MLKLLSNKRKLSCKNNKLKILEWWIINGSKVLESKIKRKKQMSSMDGGQNLTSLGDIPPSN